MLRRIDQINDCSGWVDPGRTFGRFGVRLAGLVFGLIAATSPALAQVKINAKPQRSDLDEVEDLYDETKGRNGNNLALLEVEELVYSPPEIRNRFQYLAALALGPSKPWLTYEIELGALLSERSFVAGHAGGGRYRQAGVFEEQPYDLYLTTRSFGVAWRYFIPHLERLSVDGSLDFVSWEGRVDPHGVIEGEGANINNISAAFRGEGLALGLASVVTWLWDQGFYLEWAPVGVRVSRILRKDLTRDSSSVEGILKRNIERPGFYGLTNIKFGYLF